MVEDGKMTERGCEARWADVHPDAVSTSCLPSPASVPHQVSCSASFSLFSIYDPFLLSFDPFFWRWFPN